LLRAMPEPAVTAPAVLGVDDFAFARGRRYGAVLVDLERRRPVDVPEHIAVFGRVREGADWLTGAQPVASR